MIDISIDSTNILNVAPPSGAPRRRFLTPLAEPGEFLFVLDNTAFTYITRCPRSALYYIVHNREAQTKSSALVFGGAVHAGLENLLKNKSIDEQNKAVIDYFTNHPTPINDHRTPQNALEVLKHYRDDDRLPDRKLNILSDSKGLLVERAFELPLCVIEINSFIDMPWLTNEERTRQTADPESGEIYVSKIHVAWSGRIDVIANVNGRNRVVDHKTSSITDSTTIADFHLSNQTRGYVWAARQLWPELEIDGFCVNFLSLKKPTGTGGLRDRGPRGGEPPLNFSRNYFEYSDELLTEWLINTQSVIAEFFGHVTSNYFPQFTSSCCGRFSLCQYHPVCTSDPVRRIALLTSDALYKPVTWNPVNGE